MPAKIRHKLSKGGIKKQAFAEKISVILRSIFILAGGINAINKIIPKVGKTNGTITCDLLADFKIIFAKPHNLLPTASSVQQKDKTILLTDRTPWANASHTRETVWIIQATVKRVLAVGKKVQITAKTLFKAQKGIFTHTTIDYGLLTLNLNL